MLECIIDKKCFRDRMSVAIKNTIKYLFSVEKEQLSWNEICLNDVVVGNKELLSISVDEIFFKRRVP
jgi:hypothetical protein